MSVGIELRTQLAALPVTERAELVSFLIESLDGETHPDAADLWRTELNRRAKEIQNGSAIGEPADIVLDRLRKKHS